MLGFGLDSIGWGVPPLDLEAEATVDTSCSHNGLNVAVLGRQSGTAVLHDEASNFDGLGCFELELFRYRQFLTFEGAAIYRGSAYQQLSDIDICLPGLDI